MSWGIASTAKEIEKIKADYADFLQGYNSCGKIDYSVYSEMFDYGMNLLDKAYNQGRKEAKKQGEFSNDYD